MSDQSVQKKMAKSFSFAGVQIKIVKSMQIVIVKIMKIVKIVKNMQNG